MLVAAVVSLVTVCTALLVYSHLHVQDVGTNLHTHTQRHRHMFPEVSKVTPCIKQPVWRVWRMPALCRLSAFLQAPTLPSMLEAL